MFLTAVICYFYTGLRNAFLYPGLSISLRSRKVSSVVLISILLTTTRTWKSSCFLIILRLRRSLPFWFLQCRQIYYSKILFAQIICISILTHLFYCVRQHHDSYSTFGIFCYFQNSFMIVLSFLVECCKCQDLVGKVSDFLEVERIILQLQRRLRMMPDCPRLPKGQVEGTRTVEITEVLANNLRRGPVFGKVFELVRILLPKLRLKQK